MSTTSTRLHIAYNATTISLIIYLGYIIVGLNIFNENHFKATVASLSITTSIVMIAIDLYMIYGYL